MKVLVLFYSTWGHIYRMAEAAVEGVRQCEGAGVDIRRVPETLPQEILAKMGAIEPQKAFSHIQVARVEEMADYEAIIFGTPTRYGNMCGQMRQFLDATGSLWAKDVLVGKVGSVFTGSGTQHGGQESTILTFHVTLLHLGMIIVGLPYTFKGQSVIDQVAGCSPYGASTIVGPGGERMPSEVELAGVRFQGKLVAETAQKLFL
jgi:NAD(P)H dehydrogenase (quinone)